MKQATAGQKYAAGGMGAFCKHTMWWMMHSCSSAPAPILHYLSGWASRWAMMEGQANMRMGVTQPAKVTTLPHHVPPPHST